MKTPEVQECQKKRWEECGWMGGLLGCLSYSRSKTAETSWLSVWTQGCLPIAALNYCPTHLQETFPHRRGKNTLFTMSFASFIYSKIYESVTAVKRIKITLTATLQAENSLLPFSQGCECLTKAWDSVLFQHKAAAQRVFSACRPRSDETALWHTRSRPPVSGPQGSDAKRTGYCKSKQSSRWGTQAGCQPGSKEIPSSC